MTPPHDGSIAGRVDQLGRLAATVAASRPASEVSAAERARLIATVRRRQPRLLPRVAFRPLTLGMAASLGALLVALVLSFGGRRAPLTFEADGAIVDHDYVSAHAQAPATLRFSDGSTVVIDEGGRLRVHETNPEGGRLHLERGVVHVQVQHRSARTRWVFVAGPFEVRVTGTRFHLRWDAEREVVTVRLLEGSVEVRGPLGRGPIPVHGGELFEGSVRQGTVSVAPLPPEGAVDPSTAGSSSDGRASIVPSTESTTSIPPTSAPSTTSTSSTVASSTTSTSSTVASSAGYGGARAAPSRTSGASGREGSSWSDEVRRGRFAEVLRAAEQRGLDACWSACPVTDLVALADAARYSGRDEVAIGALTAIRARAPATTAATNASFLLGRVYEGRRSLGQAIVWYRTYLGEAPEGPLAVDALGGRLRLSSGPEARAVAEEILRRYPQSVHAESARKVLAKP